MVPRPGRCESLCAAIGASRLSWSIGAPRRVCDVCHASLQVPGDWHGTGIWSGRAARAPALFFLLNAAHSHHTILRADLLLLLMQGCADADGFLRCSNEYWPFEVTWKIWDGERVYISLFDDRIRLREGAVFIVWEVWRLKVEYPAGAGPWQCLRPLEWLSVVGAPSTAAMIGVLGALPWFVNSVCRVEEDELLYYVFKFFLMRHPLRRDHSFWNVVPVVVRPRRPARAEPETANAVVSLVSAGTNSLCAAQCLCVRSVARGAISCTILSVGVIILRGTISSPWWCAPELLR